MKPETPVVVDVRAVDVGYFSTKLTLGRKLVGNASTIATALFPSLAPRLPANMSMQTALHGKPDGSAVDVDDVNYFVGRDAILYSSGREPREVLADYSMTEKYHALMRGAFHYIAQDAKATSELVIRHLVLGLPLNTFGENRDRLAARAAREHLLPDPTNPGAMRRITVEKASIIRDKAPSFTTAGNTYELAPYTSAIEAVLKESTDKMVARLGSLDNLDLILFTGGGAKVYFEFFKSRYPKFTNIMFMDDDPFFSNVKGFHVAGEI